MSSTGWGASDRVLAALLFAGVVAYLCRVPWGLGAADESYFLYEAKRLRDGEVMYRDVFQFVTPLASYAMALLFWLFGTTITTAHVAMAALHGATAALLYAASRRLGVRPVLSAVVALAHLVVCQAAWPHASWHWFSALCATAALCAMVGGAWVGRPRRAFIPGVIGGIAIGVQQQKGIVLAGGMGLVLVVDGLLDLWYRERVCWRAWALRLAWFAGGVGLIVAPLLAVFLALAGAETMYDALVRFPLDTYGARFSTAWGTTTEFLDRSTYPVVLTYSPAVLAGSLAQWLWDVGRRQGRALARQLSAVIVLSGGAVLSAWYFPDVIHIAFIAGVFGVAAAQNVERLLTAICPAVLSRQAGLFVAVLIGFPLLSHLVSNASHLRRTYPVSHETAFGRVDFTGAWEVNLVDQTRALLDRAPSRTLYSYPHYISLYLTADARNPTRYQYFNASMSPPHHTDDVLRTLRTERLPYIIALLLMPRGDPVVRYIKDNYRVLPLPAQMGWYKAYGRKDLEEWREPSDAAPGAVPEAQAAGQAPR